MGDMFAGIGIVGLLIAIVITILPFIALMCIWSNTGETAKYMKLMWIRKCETEQLDQKTGCKR